VADHLGFDLNTVSSRVLTKWFEGIIPCAAELNNEDDYPDFVIP